MKWSNLKKLFGMRKSGPDSPTHEQKAITEMTKPGSKRLLVLDELVHKDGPFTPSRLPFDTRIDVVVEGDLVENLNRYSHNKDLERKIRDMVTSYEFDAIVIGNNAGNGIWKARTLVSTLCGDVLQQKTVVVWNSTHMPEKPEYQECGIRHFVARDDLDETIWKLLELSPLT